MAIDERNYDPATMYGSQTSAPLLAVSPTVAIGYATGAGGAVTQATNKTTGVTLSKPTGQITMNNAALATVTGVEFTLTNTLIAASDVLAISIGGGRAASSWYAITANCAAGSAIITVTNLTAGTLSEALVLNFALIKVVAA